jgi:ATP-dependent RNA helicase RhlE
MGFSKFGFSEAILQGIKDSGYLSPTEIQKKALPLALDEKDIIGCAPTGTGKTAAFVLPILQFIEDLREQGYRERCPRALILTPTRELAQQIEDAIFTYGKYTTAEPVSIYGGIDIKKQLRVLDHGADIIVATPGRLLDHIYRRTIDLRDIEILVLDEADRMFDMGFIEAVREIISYVPEQRQTMLFSATMSREVRSLVSGIQHNPHLIEIGSPSKPVDSVTQYFYSIPPKSKKDLLVHILRNEQIETMLLFSRTKHGADAIARHLHQHKVHAGVIHSDRSQSQRQQSLDSFKKRHFSVLVATDIAARGIDVDGISHVVNYDTPEYPEDYIHRIGRTGRAEKKGIAITFVTEDEMKFLRRIEQLTGKRYPVVKYPGFPYPAPVITEAEHPDHVSHMRKMKTFQARTRRFM